MRCAPFIRFIQPLVDVAYLGVLFFVSWQSSTQMGVTFTNTLWPHAVFLGVFVPGLSAMAVKFALYYSAIWQKTKYKNPSWHSRHRFIPPAESLAQLAIMVWLMTLLALAGDTSTHFEFGAAIGHFLLLSVAWVLLTLASVMAYVSHHQYSRRPVRVYDDTQSQAETSFDQSLAAIDASDEPAVGYTTAVMKSEQSVGTEMQHLLLAERAAQNNATDDSDSFSDEESSEEQAGTLARTRKRYKVSKHNGKKKSWIRRMASPSARRGRKSD